jgi:hypothetical protein
MNSGTARRVRRGALAALVVTALGLSLTAGANGVGTTRAEGEQAATAKAAPITAGSRTSDGAAQAAPGDVAALAATDLTYNTVVPCRLFDTRTDGDGPVGVGKQFLGWDLNIQGACGLPDDNSVKAIMVNIIAVNTTGTGYVRAAEVPLHPDDGPTVLNFNNGLVSSNAIPLTMCDIAADLCEFDFGFLVHGGSSNIVFDLVGYFA